MIYLFNSYGEKEKTIVNNYHKENDIVLTLEENGFYEDQAISIFSYYLQDSNKKKIEKHLFANNIDVPEYWEILMRFDCAEVIDNGDKKALIEYSDPIQLHCVKRVKWLENNIVYRIDNYNKYGELYYCDFVNEKEELRLRIYLSNGCARLVYQAGFDCYELIEDGVTKQVFNSTNDFITKTLEKINKTNDVIYTSDRITAELIKQHNQSPLCLERMETNFPQKELNNEILILTNSENIENITTLIEGLDNMKFHIGARTYMSNKLLNLNQYSNVELYEGLTEDKVKMLFNKCSFYLDINYENEIYDAVYQAYKNNVLVIGFYDTLHNQKYELENCSFVGTEDNEMIIFIKRLMSDKSLYESYLKMQQSLPKERILSL